MRMSILDQEFKDNVKAKAVKSGKVAAAVLATTFIIATGVATVGFNYQPETGAKQGKLSKMVFGESSRDNLLTFAMAGLTDHFEKGVSVMANGAKTRTVNGINSARQSAADFIAPGKVEAGESKKAVKHIKSGVKKVPVLKREEGMKKKPKNIKFITAQRHKKERVKN
jgi:hypothetical protein